MKKRLLSILVCAVMIVGLLPTAASAATYDVWVGTTQVDDTNKGNVLGDGTVSYDPVTKTLTLNNYNGDYIKAE